MKAVVVDSSTLIVAIGEKGASADELANRLAALECHAPHLVDAEVGNVLRRRLLSGAISAETAETGVRIMESVVDERYPHAGPLAQAAWRLRGAVSFYDALYVALAARLGVPLLTADARLSRAPSLPCKVEVVA
jgi:predicted nucleic acid-binding protein